MTKTPSQPDGVDTMMSGLAAATKGGREEALQAWARGCDAYSRYFSALARADGPGALFAAQAEFVTDSMDVLTQNATALQRLNLNGRGAADR